VRLRALASGLVYVAFLALCAEIALQGYYRFTSGAFLFTRAAQPLWAPNHHSGFFNRANLAFDHRTNEFSVTYYTDSRGLRVPQPGLEHQLAKRPDGYRILLLGPSFAFGWAVDYADSFGAVLEALLAERGFAGDRKLDLVNAGVNSLGIAAQLKWLEAVGLEYQPDLVLQLVYGSMAVNTNAEGDSVANEDGYLVPKHYALAHRLRDQLKKSALFFYGWVIYTRTLAARQTGGVQGAGRPLEMQANFDPGSAKVAPSLAFYEQLRGVVEGAGAKLQLVYFPLSYVVHREDMARWRHLGVQDVDSQMRFDAAFCDHVAARGFDCIDITPSLVEAASGGERLYYWLDIHWTPEGNRVAARAVADHLKP